MEGNLKPGDCVKRQGQPMVVMWLEEEGNFARCRWLAGKEWQDGSFKITELEPAQDTGADDSSG